MTAHKTLLRLKILLVGSLFVTNIFGQSDPRSDSAAKDQGLRGSSDYAQCSNSPASEADSPGQEAALVSGLQFLNVDHRSFGVGSMDAGTGNISVAGISGPVTSAILYWHYLDVTSPTPPANGNVIFNGNPISGSSVGEAGTNCWGTGRSFTMMANVTGLVGGNGIYTLAGFPATYFGSGRSTNGASLIVVYNDGNSANNRNLYIFHGNDASYAEGVPGDADGWNSTISNIPWTGAGTPTLELHVADGQFFLDGGLFLNGTQIVPPGADHWNGSSVPSAGSPRFADGNYWDITSYNLGAPYFVSGNNNLNITAFAVDDCIALAVAAVSVPVVVFPFKLYTDNRLIQPKGAWLYRATPGTDVYIKFTLGGFQGTNPYSQPPVSQQISCVTKAPSGPITPLSTYVGDPYYNSFYGYYTTIWRTNAAWLGTCRRVTLFLTDGTSHSIDYWFN